VRPYYEDTRSGIALFNCDYRELLPTLPVPDLLLLDPPYEVVAAGGGIVAQRNYMQDIEGFTDGGFDMNLLDAFKNWFCFCSKNQLLRLLEKAAVRRWMLVTLNKSSCTPLCANNYLPDVEYIVHSFEPGRLFGGHREKSRFINLPPQSGSRKESEHPNEKSLSVVSKLLKLGCQPGELCVDLFAGSCTTLVAAKMLGIRAIGAEISERWAEQGAKRLQQECLMLPEVSAPVTEQQLI
jgi:DNA modification methylase